jgi:hypothetical protein
LKIHRLSKGKDVMLTQSLYEWTLVYSDNLQCWSGDNSYLLLDEDRDVALILTYKDGELFVEKVAEWNSSLSFNLNQKTVTYIRYREEEEE